MEQLLETDIRLEWALGILSPGTDAFATPMHVPCGWTKAKECPVGLGQVITCGSGLDSSATTADIS